MENFLDQIQKTEFEAFEYHADDSMEKAHYSIEGSCDHGWAVTREGRSHLSLGKGYVLLRTVQCGVCSTDLDRRFLPFALPQIIGHEFIAIDSSGQRHVVEINASHAARGVSTSCAYCSSGLANHCPERLVIGIHDLPGGFGPWLLAPKKAVFPIPDEIDNSTAILIEPFAAVLNAAQRISPKAGDRVAVLGTRRLGLLMIAALAAERRRNGTNYTIIGLSRHANLQNLALSLGADQALEPPEEKPSQPMAEIVIDTTGSAEGLEKAILLAHREVHLKSTHGQPAAGLRHTTEIVVDEITLCSFESMQRELRKNLRGEDGQSALVLWQSTSTPPKWLSDQSECIHETDPREAQRKLRSERPHLPAADFVVVDGSSGVDQALRPSPDHETGLVRARGTIVIGQAKASDGPLLTAVTQRDLRLTSSRCGDFTAALSLLEEDPELRKALPRVITHRMPIERLKDAFRLARSSECIKVIVDHSPMS